VGGAGAADPANTRSLNYGANENKAIGANVFNGNNAEETPEFIRITAIRGKNGTNGLMTLENGEEITVGQVISRADFERIFWNASKSDGSFSFLPVQDAKGTAAPNTVEQTVVIKTPETPAPGGNPSASSGEGGNTGHEAGSQTGAGSGSGTGSSTGSDTGSSTGSSANTGANGGTGTANNGTGPNNTSGQHSGNDKGNGTTQNAGSPSGTGQTSNQGANSGEGTKPAGGKPGAEGSGSENKPVTGSDSESTSGSASGSGSAGGSDSTSGSDSNKGSASDKGGSTTGEGQGGQASNGQAPSQNAGGQGSESQTAPQTPSGQGGSEQTTAPTQGSQSGGQPPAQNTSGQGDVSQTPPQNAGGGSDTGNPATGNPSTSDTTQTGGSQTGGAQTGGSQTGTGETGSDGNHGNGDHGDGNQTSDDGQASHDGENDSAKDDGKHDGADSKGDGTKGEDTKGEDGEQSKNGDDSASPTNPPTTTSPPTPPDYAPNQSVQQAIHANNKPVGASIFNGTNPAHAPSFVKITAVLDKDGEEVPDAMTLGKEGEAITTDQVISKEQFDNVFLDALKAPGGSFKFIPVMDSEGTEMPGATEQTVSIGFDYVYHFSKQPFLDAIEGEERFSHYKVHLITEHQDTNNTLDGMFKLDGDQRTPLKVGDLIRPEDFDKLYWDYTSNNGGRFELAGLDSQGHEISNEEHLQLYMADYAKTRTGKVPPEEPGGEETDVEDSEDSNDIAGHSAALHPESFTDAASAFHGSSHLSVNGQSTLDNLLEHQVSHGIL
jgi:similarity